MVYLRRDFTTKYITFEIYFDYIILCNQIYLLHNPKRPKCIDILSIHYQYNPILIRRALNELLNAFKIMRISYYSYKRNIILIMDTIVTHIMCKYFDNLTIDTDEQQLDEYENNIYQVVHRFFKFNDFIKSFHPGYMVSLKILQKKYKICDDVCKYIKSFIV